LRAVSLLLAVAGTVLLIALARPVSVLTFGGEQHWIEISVLALAVLFGGAASGQAAIIQGMRRIGDLAKLTVLAGALGTLLSLSVVYIWRHDGIAPSLVAIAAASLLTSTWFSRKLKLPPARMTRLEACGEARALVRLGLAFMASGFVVLGAGYAVNAIVARMAGLEAAGLYQSAWTVSGLYIGFILQSMGADFYPRLVGKADDHPECNRLVNEQAHVGLLLAAPGVIGTLTFSPLLVTLLYSEKFLGAADVLRWLCLGMMLRVITWPMGFILLAKGSQRVLVVTEVAWAAANVTLAWWCVREFGLNGAGVAFFGAYLFQGLVLYPTVRWMTGFRWSSSNMRAGLLLLSLVAAVFASVVTLPPMIALIVGALATCASGVYAFSSLLRASSTSWPASSSRAEQCQSVHEALANRTE
jgi:PST family polysaccharide transporter